MYILEVIFEYVRKAIVGAISKRLSKDIKGLLKTEL